MCASNNLGECNRRFGYRFQDRFPHTTVLLNRFVVGTCVSPPLHCGEVDLEPEVEQEECPAEAEEAEEEADPLNVDREEAVAESPLGKEQVLQV